jgi:uncharacterized cupin superfamily protein
MERRLKPSACLIRRKELEALPLQPLVHQHNPSAIRHTVCLTDALGFEDMGVHLVHLKPGDLSSEHHYHEEDEEFVYILSGRALAFIGDEELEVGPGDFMAFPKHSPPHHMQNRGDRGVVYLVGGTRSSIDICNYPRRGLRQYRIHGQREFVKVEDVRPVAR